MNGRGALRVVLVGGVLGLTPMAHAQPTCAEPEESVAQVIERCGGASTTCIREGLIAIQTRCPAPFVQLSLGANEAAAGHPTRAWELLNEALAARDPNVESHRREIELNVLPDVRRRIALLAPRCRVEGAVVEFDGFPIARLPLAAPHAVLPGEVHIRVRAPGHRDAVFTRSLRAGEMWAEDVVLVPDVPAAGAPPRPAAGAGRVAGLTLMTVGGAAVLAGVALWIGSAVEVDSQQAEITRATATTDGALGGYVRFGASIGAPRRNLSWSQQCDEAARASGPDADAAREVCGPYERLGTAAWVTGLVGAGLVVAGGVVLAVTRPRAGAPRVGVIVVPGYVGGGASWTF